MNETIIILLFLAYIVSGVVIAFCKSPRLYD